MTDQVIKLAPFYYIHVLDRNKNVTSLVIGPQTFTCLDHQRVCLTPTPMITIPPNHYCVIENPIVTDDKGEAIVDRDGQIQLKHSVKELRFATKNNKPFPLYPGEQLIGKMRPLQIVPVGQALRIRAIEDFIWQPLTDDHEQQNIVRSGELETPGGGEKNEGVQRCSTIFRRAGDEWLFAGPGTYIPSISEEVIEVVHQIILKPGQALKLKAIRDCEDEFEHKSRVTGEMWLMSNPGPYLPGAYESVVAVLDPLLLTETQAVHLRAMQDYVDCFDHKRHAGEEWLITLDETQTYLLGVHEELVSRPKLLTLTKKQYAIIENPIDPQSNKPLIGTQKIIWGPKNFFLQPPHECLIKQGDLILLDFGSAIELRANDNFYDEQAKKSRKPGDRWLVKGPGEYRPVLEADIVSHKRAVFANDGSGIQIYSLSEIMLVFIAILVVFIAWIKFV